MGKGNGGKGMDKREWGKGNGEKGIRDKFLCSFMIIREKVCDPHLPVVECARE